MNLVASTKTSGSGHLLWPKWCSSVEDVPHDLMTAIEHGQKVISWYENLPEEEIPPRWMWPLDHELETWFLEMKRIREAGASMSSPDDQDSEMMENEFAARFKDD
jgi:hypothetical protein